MKQKWLYKFVANKTETKTETKKVKDSDGKESNRNHFGNR
jgi:hypothetical protein